MSRWAALPTIAVHSRAMIDRDRCASPCHGARPVRSGSTPGCKPANSRGNGGRFHQPLRALGLAQLGIDNSVTAQDSPSGIYGIAPPAPFTVKDGLHAPQPLAGYQSSPLSKDAANAQ